MDIFAALWPVFALLFLGVLINRFQFVDHNFWSGAEKIIYYLCFPALLVTRLVAADFNGSESFVLIEAVLLLLALGSLFLIALQRLLKFRAASFTSVYQGGLRFNTYITLAIAASLIPGEGLVIAAIIASVMIPLLNLLCVLVFAIYSDERPSALTVFKQILSNPLILGCLVGLALNLSQLGIPVLVTPVLELLAQVALPLGLLAVGAGINLKAMRSSGVPLMMGVATRLIVMPLFGLVVGSLLQLSEEALLIFMVFASVPTASAAYILAKQLNGDAPLVANIISAQTILSMLTLPVALSLTGLIL
jgi:predicted permease